MGENKKMIVVIRIKGLVEIRGEFAETLNRLRLRRKYSCVIAREKPEIIGMIEKVRNFVAYGKISKEMLVELIKKRGKPDKTMKGEKGSKEKVEINVEKDAEKIASEFFESKVEKKLEDFGLKPFFRLHPPRGGIKSKEHFPRGVLGDHGEKINELLRRML